MRVSTLHERHQLTGRRAQVPRRFAALRSTSLAHVDVSWPAAASRVALCASVSRIRSSAALRSSGGLGGRPRSGFFPIKNNVATKNSLSISLTGLFCVATLNGDKETPAMLRTRPGQHNPACTAELHLKAILGYRLQQREPIVETREQRGLVIAAKNRIQNQGRHWLVPSQSEVSKKYKVIADDGCSHCTCPDHELTGQTCKHIYAVRFVIQRELFDDGTEVETRQVTITETRKTYPQNWPVYNASQTSEKAKFQELLYDLCQSIPESTEARMGRPRLPLRDGMFCACFKVYSMLSSRRFTSDLCDAHAKGYISRVPHFNSVLNVFDAPETERLLMNLVAQSALPLAAVESISLSTRPASLGVNSTSGSTTNGRTPSREQFVGGLRPMPS